MSEKNSKKRKVKEEDESMKKALKMETKVDEKLEKSVEKMGEVLPLIKKSKKDAISNEDLEKLFYALCGHAEVNYDSDDSIVSDIDHMDAEEIAAKDKRFRDLIASLPGMSEESKRLEEILKIGNETSEEKAARKRRMREHKEGLMTEEAKKAAELKRIESARKREKRLNTTVQVFSEKKEKSKIPYLTCSTFASILEILVEFVSEEEDSENDHRENVKAVDATKFAEKIKFMGIKTQFYTGTRSAECFVLKKVRRLLDDADVYDVFNGKRYGFKFNTKQCLMALENYYTLNKPSSDNGKSISPLAVKIRPLVNSAFHVSRKASKSFVLNDYLKSVLFD